MMKTKAPVFFTLLLADVLFFFQEALLGSRTLIWDASDAVNRGMALMRGRVLGWLNSDDRLRPDVLVRVADLLDHDHSGWVYGQAGMINDRGEPVSSFIARYKNWRGRRFSRLKLLTENLDGGLLEPGALGADRGA
jgi:hypothetical protein